MPYEEMEETEEVVEEESEEKSEDKKDYTVEEMLEYMLNEVNSVDEAKALMEEHGFDLKKSGGPDGMAEIMPPMPLPMPKPRVNIIELRLDAAKKAMGEKDKKEN